MTAVECRACDRPVPDGAPICSHCTGTLVEALRDVPDLIDDLLVTLAKQDRLSSGSRRGTGEQPLPLRLDVPDAVWVLGNVLTTWARDLASLHGWPVDARQLARPVVGSAADPWVKGKQPAPARSELTITRCAWSDLPREACAHCTDAQLPDGVRPDEQDTVLRHRTAPVLGRRPPTALNSLAFAAGWLADHADALRRHPAADQAHDELGDALQHAAAACNAPPVRVFVGPCETCGADLYGWPDHRATRCGRCGQTYTDMRERWDAALYRLRGYPATAATIAGAVGELYGAQVNRKAINVWHHRGRITAVDVDDEGSPRFRIGDVLDQAARSRRKAG